VAGSTTIVKKLDPETEGEALRKALEAEGVYRTHGNPSARWAMKGPGVVISFYRSGKCVVQGGGAREFAEAHLGGAQPAAEAKLETLETDLIGTDESGKGDYFGPLVAAAVLVPKGQEEVLAELGVRDSKLLSDRAAEETARAIRAGYPCGVVCIGPERYNELYEDFGNLNRLLGWATAQAVAEVYEKHPCDHVLSDKFGDERHIANALKKKGIEVDLVQKVRAESNPAVAAASIVARDRFLSELARLSREEGFKIPKGAGSPVLVAGRRLYRESGMDALRRVAKIHFKTTKQIAGELF